LFIRTLDDPDISANGTIIAASIVYFIYNCQVLNDSDQYETNMLFKLGDKLYLANAVFYVTAAMRDCGFFWFMPVFGEYKTIAELLRDDEASEYLIPKADTKIIIGNAGGDPSTSSSVNSEKDTDSPFY
jgi:hypothetical protein